MPKFARAESPVLARLTLVLATFCALFAVVASRADAAPWSAPEAVSAPGADASASEVGVDAAGDATAIWTDGGPLVSVVQTAYRPAGGGWEAPEDLTPLGGKADEAELAVDPAGDAVAVWRAALGSESLVRAAFRPAGGSWQPAETVASSVGSVETPRVTIDEAGDAVLVWREAGGEILASHRPMNGSWATGVFISPGGAEAPAVAIDASGEAVVVWQDSSGPTSQVETNTMSPGGNWSSPTPLSSPAAITEPPQVEVDAAGEFFALWSSGGPGSRTVEVDRKPAGGSWEGSHAVSSPGLEAHEPALAVDAAGDAVAAWYRFDGSVGSVEAASLTAGGSWGSPTRLSPADANAEAPRIAISPTGVAQVVWTGIRGSEHNFELSTNRLQVNASWKASITVDHEGRSVFAPRIGIGHTGSTVVIWSVETEVGFEIKSSTHDERSPLSVTKSGAGSGTVTSFPARIDCGSVCDAEFLEGVTVTLTATPAAGSRFAGWSGACSGSGACEVEIGEEQTVNAEFASTSTGGDGSGGDTSTSGGSGDAAAKSAGAVPLTAAPGAPSCMRVTAARVSGFVPKTEPGQVVPGVRAKVSVARPSTVRVSAMLGFGKGSSVRLASLGSASFHTVSSRNLRFALPGSLRSALPFGSGARLILSIAARPDSEGGCARPSVVKRHLAVKVVKVLSGRQAGVN